MNKAFHFTTFGIACAALVISIWPDQTDPEKPLNSAEYLSPSDLNIEKHVFRAKPGKDEVVYLECKMLYDGKLVKKMINYIHTDGKVHEEPLIVIDKYALLTVDEQLAYDKKFKSFAPLNLEFICSGFIESANHLHFNGSRASHNNFTLQAGAWSLETNTNEAEFHYLDMSCIQAEKEGIKPKPVDFYFTMTTMPYSEAKAKQPELEEMKANHGWTYQDADYGQGVIDYQKAAEESLDRQLNFKG
ncbi:hypothetical protein SAMN02745181_1246 [Rubritalea squalenifaciens DSM 18772]|uniref:Uncharacterized protein n=1 Tax=Rubritalea squalenifaciens DSM 18772 TaxID=1123071 RepID=A0A1M6GRS0_9BACT|nr:hypothetical protein [Rubritalea squalenifaciens]SHJ12630.1 hypothetical protein SAMN02745181_1246 [Rubritalea squalenifaciens DSM 18772]